MARPDRIVSLGSFDIQRTRREDPTLGPGTHEDHQAHEGAGWLQTPLRRIQKQIQGNILDAADADVERLIRYSFEYGQGGLLEQAKAVADSGTRRGSQWPKASMRTS